MTRLSDIRARAEAATPGPWGWHAMHYPNTRVTALRSETARYPEYPGVPVSVIKSLDHSAYKQADAEFIAEARVDVPWLLDRLAEAERLARVSLDWPMPQQYRDLVAAFLAEVER